VAKTLMNKSGSVSYQKSKQWVWDERSRPKAQNSDTGFGLLFLDGSSFDFLPAGVERMAEQAGLIRVRVEKLAESLCSSLFSPHRG
jgi:hypothetical protein